MKLELSNGSYKKMNAIFSSDQPKQWMLFGLWLVILDYITKKWPNVKRESAIFGKCKKTFLV